MRFFRDINQHRIIISSRKSLFSPANVICENITIKLGHSSFSIDIYRHWEYCLQYPTIFYIPGTAFIADDSDFSHVFCSHLAEKTRYQVIKLSHRLAPEHQYPAAYNDICRLFYYFTKVNPKGFKIDTRNIIISGYSSGGNLAALLSLQAKKKNISRQILISPMVDFSRTDKGFKMFEDLDTFPNHEEFIKWMLELYLPNTIRPTSSAVSPYWTPKNKLKTLPPTDIIFGEFDLVRGDCEAYKKKLSSSFVNINGSFMFDKCDHSLLWKNPIKIAELIYSRITLPYTMDKPIVTVIVARKEHAATKKEVTTSIQPKPVSIF